MKILLIDLFRNEEGPSNKFLYFQTVVTSSLRTFCLSKDNHELLNPEIIYRKFDDLSDYILDWETEFLDQRAECNALAFDGLDMVCIYGDTLPWTITCRPLVILLRLCDMTSKCVFTMGGGTLATIFSSAISGGKCEIINSPYGSPLHELTSFSKCMESKNPLLGAWLDNESGDLYSFDDAAKKWVPFSNVGCHRSSGVRSAAMSSKNNRKWIAYSKIGKSVEPLGSQQIFANIRAKSVQHYSVKNIPNRKFRIPILKEWQLNKETGLPLSKGIQVIADSEQGPILLSQGNKLMIVCELSSVHPVCEDLRKIAENYFNYTLDQILTNGTLHSSLHDIVFGKVSFSKFSTKPEIRHRNTINIPGLSGKELQRPLSSTPVPSSLAYGPSMIQSINENSKMNINQIFKIPSTPVVEGEEVVVIHRDAALNRDNRLSNITATLGYGIRNVESSVYRKIIDRSRLSSTGILETSPRPLKQRLSGTADNLASPSLSPSPPTGSVSGHPADFPIHRLSVAVSVLTNVSTQSSNSDRIGKVVHPTIKEKKSLYASSPRIQQSQYDHPLREYHAGGMGSDKDEELRPETKASVEDDYQSNQSSPRVRSAGYGPHLNAWVNDHDHSGIDKMINNSTKSSLVERIQALHLPVFHPSSDEPTTRVIRRRSKSSDVYRRSKSSSKVDVEEIHKQNQRSEYLGQYTSTFKTPFEREMKDERISKAKFVGGAFKAYFGKASELPLRKEGGVRPHGPYFGEITFEQDRQQPANDWIISRIGEDKNLRVAGPWIKS